MWPLQCASEEPAAQLPSRQSGEQPADAKVSTNLLSEKGRLLFEAVADLNLSETLQSSVNLVHLLWINSSVPVIQGFGRDTLQQ